MDEACHMSRFVKTLIHPPVIFPHVFLTVNPDSRAIGGVEYIAVTRRRGFRLHTTQSYFDTT